MKKHSVTKKDKLQLVEFIEEIEQTNSQAALLTSSIDKDRQALERKYAAKRRICQSMTSSTSQRLATIAIDQLDMDPEHGLCSLSFLQAMDETLCNRTTTRSKQTEKEKTLPNQSKLIEHLQFHQQLIALKNNLSKQSSTIQASIEQNTQRIEYYQAKIQQYQKQLDLPKTQCPLTHQSVIELHQQLEKTLNEIDIVEKEITQYSLLPHDLDEAKNSIIKAKKQLDTLSHQLETFIHSTIQHETNHERKSRLSGGSSSTSHRRSMW